MKTGLDSVLVHVKNVLVHVKIRSKIYKLQNNYGIGESLHLRLTMQTKTNMQINIVLKLPNCINLLKTRTFRTIIELWKMVKTRITDLRQKYRLYLHICNKPILYRNRKNRYALFVSVHILAVRAIKAQQQIVH